MEEKAPCAHDKVANQGDLEYEIMSIPAAAAKALDSQVDKE